MRWASDCTMGRENVPRGLDWISAEKLVVLDLLVASKAMRPITGFSTTVTTIRPPGVLMRTSWNRPVSISAFRPLSISAWPRRPPGPGRNRNGWSRLRRGGYPRPRSRPPSGQPPVTRQACQRGGNRHGEHDQGANTPPRTRIPNFMRHAPLSFRSRPLTQGPADSQPVAPLVANFAGGATL